MTASGNSRRGCLFYTGIAIAISIVVLLIASYAGYRYAKSLVNRFTDTEPMAVPAPALTEAETLPVRERIKVFGNALQQGNSPEPLAISADEANALFAYTPELTTVRGKMQFDFQGSNVFAQFSIPAEDLGLKPLKGRYVNASGTFVVGVSNGLLNVNARNLSAKGEPLPETFMNRIAPQNFAFKLNQQSNAQPVIGRIGEVRVENGRLLVVPRN